MKHKVKQIKLNSWTTIGNHLDNLVSNQIRIKISGDTILSYTAIIFSMFDEIKNQLKT